MSWREVDIIGRDWTRADTGLYLPGQPDPPSQPVGIDLFAGAGGFSCGFHQAGWHVVAATDNDVDSTRTYLCNLGGPDTRLIYLTDDDRDAWDKAERRRRKRKEPDAPPGSGWIKQHPDARPCRAFFFGDVHALTGQQILDELGLQSDDVGCVFGGPPCQGFSRAGRRDPGDERNELVFEFMRIVCEIHPRSFCMENVPGILSMTTHEGVPVLDALALMAEEGGMGTFQAIRDTLAQTAGAGIALRTRKQPARPRRDGRDDDQLSLDWEPNG